LNDTKALVPIIVDGELPAAVYPVPTFGLHNNAANLRSYKGINAVWVDEAHSVSDASWEALVPTVARNEGYQIFISFNPMTPDDAVARRYVDSDRDDVLRERRPPRSRVRQRMP
jgi:phage terminase large subunit